MRGECKSAWERAVLRINRVREEVVCRRAGIDRAFLSRVSERVLRWFGHVENGRILYG